MKIRNTAIQDWKDCREKFRRTWHLGWFSPPSPALLMGRAVHAGLAAHYTGKDAEAAIRADYAAEDTSRLGAVELEARAMDEGIAVAMVNGYIARYGDEHFDDVRVEVPFECPIGTIELDSGLRTSALTGTIDLMARKGGRPLLIEHKTTSEITRLDDYFDQAAMSPQIHGYLLGAFHLTAEPVHDVLYNVLRKPSIRKTLKETPAQFVERVRADYLERPDFYFARRLITISAAQLRAFATEWRAVAYDIVNGRVYRNTGSCLKWNRRCEHLDDCLAGVEPSGPRLIQDLKKAREGFFLEV